MNDDLISRKALKNKVNSFFDSQYEGLVSSDLIKYAEAVDDFIDNAPTIDSLDLDVHIGGRCCGKRQRLLDELRPKGKWLELNGHVYDYRCSCCQYISYDEKTNFCPNCGARMER